MLADSEEVNSAPLLDDSTCYLSSKIVVSASSNRFLIAAVDNLYSLNSFSSYPTCN